MALKCEHCGTVKTYADAQIADIRGEKCGENISTKHADEEWGPVEKQLPHSWVEK